MWPAPTSRSELGHSWTPQLRLKSHYRLNWWRSSKAPVSLCCTAGHIGRSSPCLRSKPQARGEPAKQTERAPALPFRFSVGTARTLESFESSSLAFKSECDLLNWNFQIPRKEPNFSPKNRFHRIEKLFIYSRAFVLPFVLFGCSKTLSNLPV